MSKIVTYTDTRKPVSLKSKNSLVWWPYVWENGGRPVFCSSFSDLLNESHPGFKDASLRGRTLKGAYWNYWVGVGTEAELVEMAEVLQSW